MNTKSLEAGMLGTEGHFFLLKIYLFEKQRERGREGGKQGGTERWREGARQTDRQREPQWLVLGGPEARNQDLLCLPCECRGPRSWATLGYFQGIHMELD